MPASFTATRLLAPAASLAVLAALHPAVRAAGAQTGTTPPPTDAAPAFGARPADRLAAYGSWRHLGAASIAREAGQSMTAGLALDLRPTTPGSAPFRLELGWLRAANRSATAQGVTLGLARSYAVDETRGRVVVRPAVTVLAGWAESQATLGSYQWRDAAGRVASAPFGTIARGSTVGAAVGLGAEWRLRAGFALTADVQRWTFAGPDARPIRGATRGGVGLALYPAVLRRYVRESWRGPADGRLNRHWDWVATAVSRPDPRPALAPTVPVAATSADAAGAPASAAPTRR